MTKTETYIGFAIKKGSVVFGCDNIKHCKRRLYLILATPTLSQNSRDLLERESARQGVPLLTVSDFDILSKRNCKALALTDQSLAQAILNVK